MIALINSELIKIVCGGCAKDDEIELDDEEEEPWMHEWQDYALEDGVIRAKLCGFLPRGWFGCMF